jgi:hypothetical protein
MAHYWDERTWYEGFQRGYVEGEAEGRYEGYRAQRSDLLHALDTWETDLRLGLHGPLSALEVWHELRALVTQTTAGSMLPDGRGRYAGEQSWWGAQRCGAADAGAAGHR